MKSGFIAVVGRANAGKSTLINVLVGEKVSIVSPKPQTTRDRILGVLTTDLYQIAFVDTPGVYKAHNGLTDVMMKTTEESVKDVDFLLLVVDGHEGLKSEDIELIKKYRELPVKKAIAFTKTDIMPKEKIPETLAEFSKVDENIDVFPISARKGKNLKNLLEYLVSELPDGDKLFEEEIVSDKSERFMIREIMREKILLKYEKEIPHGVAVVVNTFERNERGVYEISVDIVCEKQAHKAILIGKQGGALKETASFARQDMEKFLGAKVFLTTFVKVKEEWRSRPQLLKEFGYEPPKNL